jgi:hypothetical protein
MEKPTNAKTTTIKVRTYNSYGDSVIPEVHNETVYILNEDWKSFRKGDHIIWNEPQWGVGGRIDGYWGFAPEECDDDDEDDYDPYEMCLNGVER